MEDKLVYSDILKAAWKGLKSQFWLLVGLIIGFTIVYSLLMIFTAPAKGETVEISGIIISILSYFIVALFIMGYLKNCLQTLDGEEPQFSAYGQVSRKLIIYLIAHIIMSIIIIIGTVLLIVPGIYLMLRLQFFYAFIVEENAGVIDSFKRSWNITKGSTLKLFILFLISLLICIIGCLAFFVGIFVATPFIVLMYGYTYRKLTAPAA
jgi:Predicted integral membrane protein